MLTNKDYCDYDTCVALKELGIGWENVPEKWAKRYSFIRITLYDAQKWLRKDKGVIVEVFVDDDSDTPITYNIHKDGECVCHHHGRYWSVEEWETVLSEGIKEAVKILKEG